MSFKRQTISISVRLFRNCALHQSRRCGEETGLPLHLSPAAPSAARAAGARLWPAPRCAQVARRDGCGCAADLGPRRAKSHLSLSAGMVRQLREFVLSDGKGAEMHRVFGGGRGAGGRNVLENISSV